MSGSSTADDEYGKFVARHVFAVSALVELVELRCSVRGCPEPLIGYAPAGDEADAESQRSREQHYWRVHEIPRRYKEAADRLNANPELLDEIAPGAGAVIREYGLKFTWEELRG